MRKTKCVRDFKCETCGIPDMLQALSNHYAKVRHYQRFKNGKPFQGTDTIRIILPSIGRRNLYLHPV